MSLIDQGEIQLSAKRKVSVSEYRGAIYVNIREHYLHKQSGEWRPSTKGIALSLAQWQILKDSMPKIDEQLNL
jgi:activated RNA polymerase II transcriptional coactivator p15